MDEDWLGVCVHLFEGWVGDFDLAWDGSGAVEGDAEIPVSELDDSEESVLTPIASPRVSSDPEVHEFVINFVATPSNYSDHMVQVWEWRSFMVNTASVVGFKIGAGFHPASEWTILVQLCLHLGMSNIVIAFDGKVVAHVIALVFDGPTLVFAGLTFGTWFTSAVHALVDGSAF